MQVIIGTKNEAKIKGTIEAFNQLYPGLDIDVCACRAESHVARQPLTKEDTLKGSFNRALNARELYPYADFFVGVEDGLRPSKNRPGYYVTTSWAYVIDAEGNGIKGSGGGLYIPPKMGQLVVHQGLSLKQAMLATFPDYEQCADKGAVGYLVNGLTNRVSETAIVVARALVPHKFKDLYKGSFERV